MTIHKIQGRTIPPPKTITSDLSKNFDGSQAYTVLSKIKKLDQLFLLNDVYRHKIYTSPKALKAPKELEDRAINSNCIGEREDQLKIACLNIQSIIHHIEDVKHHHKLHKHDLLFLCETWLCNTLTDNASNTYQLANYTQHYNNIGNGKGLAAFSNPILSLNKPSQAVTSK